LENIHLRAAAGTAARGATTVGARGRGRAGPATGELEPREAVEAAPKQAARPQRRAGQAAHGEPTDHGEAVEGGGGAAPFPPGAQCWGGREDAVRLTWAC
jgi:hypothetical protein